MRSAPRPALRVDSLRVDSGQRPARRLLLVLACALAAANGARAQTAAVQDPPAAELARPKQERAQGESFRFGREPSIERWNTLPPEERARLAERFQAWQRMDETQRAELRRRHERLRAAERAVRGELPADARRCLEGLAPDERRALLRRHVEGELFERGSRMRGLLPADVRERLESATPAERAQLLTDLRRRFEGEGLARGLREVGRRLELAPEDVERLNALPPALQRSKLLQLRRLEITRRVAREGLPAWIPVDQWALWQGLPDEQFLERLHAARPRRTREGERWELWRLLRPDPRWFEELAELEPAELNAELERRTAERVLEGFAAHPDVVAPAELDALRALAPADVLERARETLRATFGERRGGLGRDHRGPPDDCEREGEPRPRGGGPPGAI